MLVDTARKILLPARSPDQFTAFAILYMIPMVHELGDRWWSMGGRQPPFVLQALILTLILFVAVNVSPLSFLFFTAISVSYYLLTSFPENPNHVNLLIYCNLTFIICIPILMIRLKSGLGNDQLFTAMKPVLRLLLITLLFVSGFHKFNVDFLNPEVSCTKFVLGLFERRVQTEIFGIPFFVIIVAILLVFASFMVRRSRAVNIEHVIFGCLFIVVAGFVLAMVTLVSGADIGRIVVTVGALAVLTWQLIEGPLLFIRKLQAPILLMSVLLLGMIAVSGVPIFPAMFLPLLFSFIPDPAFKTWKSLAVVRVWGFTIHAIYIYLLLNLFGALLVYGSEAATASEMVNRLALSVSQICFLVGNVFLLFPLLRGILSSDREWRWEGLQVWDSGTPRLFLLFPLFLLLWGMTPYLGLRTAGNFSMFSNLKTEDAESNHLLLSGNPLKFWDYQEDRVRIIEVDDDRAKIGHHFDPLEGNSVPVVEFRKMVTMWREAGTELAMTYAYGGDIVHAGDIVRDDRWAGAGRNWESFWLDFRPVQEAGPNRCRW